MQGREAAVFMGNLPQYSISNVQELKYCNWNNPIRLHNKLSAGVKTQAQSLIVNNVNPKKCHSSIILLNIYNMQFCESFYQYEKKNIEAL